MSSSSRLTILSVANDPGHLHSFTSFIERWISQHACSNFSPRFIFACAGISSFRSEVCLRLTVAYERRWVCNKTRHTAQRIAAFPRYALQESITTSPEPQVRLSRGTVRFILMQEEYGSPKGKKTDGKQHAMKSKSVNEKRYLCEP